MVTSRVITIHASEEPSAETWHGSVFLAGPSPRQLEVPSWRPEAVDILRQLWTGPGTLTVFVPEGAGYRPLSYDRHEWETRWLSTVDVIAFWVPRDMETMPALNTNIEFGRWESSGRMVFGAPSEAQHVGYMRECAQRLQAPTPSTLKDTMAAAISLIGMGAQRSGGQRDIPLILWRTRGFADWLAEQQGQGRVLAKARLLWIELSHGSGRVERWALRASFGEGDETHVGTPEAYARCDRGDDCL